MRKKGRGSSATINGSAAADTISPSGISAGVSGSIPGSGADFISGLGGNDVLDGGGGANTLLGGAGNDTIFASGLGESLDGGDGVNTYVYVGSDWAFIDLGTGATGTVLKAGVTDTLVGFEAAYGGSGNDTIKGTNAQDTLGGGQGSDSIEGRGGFDMVDYGTAYGDAPTMGAVVNLSLAGVTLGGIAYGSNTARDSWGSTDILSGIEGAIGTAFGDTLIGRTGSGTPSRLEGGAGNDSLAGGNLAKDGQTDAAPNTILGGAGDDTIQSNGYDESLFGGDGIDTLTYAGSLSATIELGTENHGSRRPEGIPIEFRQPDPAY